MVNSVFARSRDWMRWHLSDVLSDSSNYLISISCPSETEQLWIDNASLRNGRAIRLRFADIEYPCDERIISPNGDNPIHVKLMTRGQAQLIVDFVVSIHSRPEHITLYVNCLAGISRSGAIAKFVQQSCQINPEIFSSCNPDIYPNLHVLRLLHEVSRADSRLADSLELG